MDKNEDDKQGGPGNDDRLVLARLLVSALEAGDEGPVGDLLSSLGVQQDRTLFNELGRLTRDLHEALNNFRLDSRVIEITHEEIPNAKERLSYVVTLTEQAAHRTLNAIEDSMPRLTELSQRAESLSEGWSKFKRRELSVEEFRELGGSLDDFLADVKQQISAVSTQLSDVMMAQDFQDLTGQVIRRVIELVQEVEEGLVGIVKVASERLLKMEGKQVAETPADESSGKGFGPAVPGVDKAGIVSGQDEVDDLLSSLGF
ncbi:protein phosphatase CheZ [Acidihalobacter prosperus]|uniref:Protein phosphatase CheZ n=1 Tax=Acidihalobacter prosperus TaxID=160660 RepID=A0A1A6C5G5_9GAMM|nr:protein phosphatase CheZ [Acidihalobacter prosperus]OBS09802.1 chemotaxis protein CheZ [Acidihalobacter prosperus]